MPNKISTSVAHDRRELQKATCPRCGRVGCKRNHDRPDAVVVDGQERVSPADDRPDKDHGGGTD